MAIQKETLEKSINTTKSSLSGLIQSLDMFVFPEATIKTFQVSNLDIEDIVSDIPIGSNEEDFIYVIKVVGQNKNNREFYRQLEKEKERQKEQQLKKDLPRLNEQHRGSQYLYVGRSHKLRSRIRQHLSDRYEGTYALHMMRWAKCVKENVELQYFCLKDQDNLLVQAVEDSLWSELKPAFGRKGDK
ncbi:hypothetical protein L3I75_004588 [Vibrio vulnificus]|uniref:hypothetical protein n=1 Tax=Vibrio vulnificus TaxID=672 RepID=UPI001302AEF8|nr:hypothetical protein [Vibrio vulnificus]ELI6429494.1 hypothetical protein [Vibrio harveyi]EIU7615471.1 hypothetical protein [Vibrio vulnificus]EIU7865365.1 hypothetical protein [Vibrio vulnificus]EJE8581440.1 hypothetical protein [Vibrio vulnificus]MCU8208138.1 hypothetical protein [Vibrio vulnificus]